MTHWIGVQQDQDESLEWRQTGESDGDGGLRTVKKECKSVGGEGGLTGGGGLPGR